MNNQSAWSSDQNKKTKKENKKLLKAYNQKPTSAYIGASWVALFIGISSYCIGLWNVEMELNEKGYYFTVLLFALFSVISVQKSVRDRLEGIKVTEIYYSISWFTTIASIILLIVGLWNANLLLSEKGFYAMSFVLSIYAAISVQKNTRDIECIEKREEKEEI
ncbi:inner membrane protein YiaA [Tenacibaculum sp. FZY0031]|uniref:inner membrane protein YiaA n=1 Tax=unclassified Tenacibaculum TaxID=2635139 RepID=UPI002EAB521A|nr:inner membrane protein YiaA [Tenacibaculum sp. FZY0031]